jgi:hypothetical protein
MSEILPPNEKRAQNWDDEPLVPLKYQHSDGSVTAPDTFGTQILPPSPVRAAMYEKAKPESIKYLLPDGSVADGGGLIEMLLSGGGSGGVSNYAGLSGKPQINGVTLKSGNNTLSDLKLVSTDELKEIKLILGKI